ncbi:MAG: hypothetical protein IKY23_10370 [Lachnospiraceae bacterium]|nr:hypothetical protein [Lachnospiraceae bacterium]
MEKGKEIYGVDYINAGRWVTATQKSFNKTCPFILGLVMDSKTAEEVYNQLLYDGVVKKENALSYANMSQEEFELLLSSRMKNNLNEMTDSEKKVYLKHILFVNGFRNVVDEKIGFTYRATKAGREYAVYITEDEQSVYDAIVSSRLQNTEGILIIGQNFVERHVILASYLKIELYDASNKMIVITKSEEGIIPLLKEVTKDLDEIDIERRTLEHLYKSEKLWIKCIPIACGNHRRVFQLQGVSIEKLQVVNRFTHDFLNETAKYKDAHMILAEGNIYLYTN